MNLISSSEKKINQKFIKNGYIISKINNKKKLIKLIKEILKIVNASKYSKKKISNLNYLHKCIDYANINNFRLDVINKINKLKYFRPNYFNFAKDQLFKIVGNELMMQKNINLSIQLPNDETSLLPLHSDVWSGDSPYEANVWMPLVDCYKSKSMYILKPKHYQYFLKIINQKKFRSSDDIYLKIRNKLTWIKINLGEILIFNQSLPHGNIVNKENETRWSFNCRFKSIHSPYKDKKTGEFFIPLIIRPMTMIGINYKDPFEK